MDPRGNDWHFTYNALDQCIRAESPVNLTERCATEFSYDANDNLVQSTVEVRDAADTKTGDLIFTFAYDLNNRLIRVTEPVSAKANAVTEFAYNDNDQVTEIRSPLATLGLDSHNIQARQYDERGLLFQKIEAPGSPLQCTTQVDYDANGNPTRLSEGMEGTPGITTMEYDGFAGFGIGSQQKKVLGTFTLIGCGLRQASNSPPTIKGVYKHLSCLAGRNSRLSKVTDPMGNVTTFHYDMNDNLKVERHSGEINDVPGSANNIRLAESRFDYDALDLCVTRHDLHFNPATQAPVGDGEATTHIIRCPNGDCSSITDDLGHTTAFSYDTAGRVYSVSVPASKSVTTCLRDAVGNVTSMTRTDTPDLGGPPQVFTITNVYDSRNRCVSSTDSAGNTGSCAYDSLDQIVRETDPNGNDSTHAYDGLGNCLTSTHYSGSSSVQPAVVVRASHAAYDANSRCIASTDANSNTTSYAYDSLDRLVTTTHADGTQVSLVWSPRSNLIGETDANGNVISNTYDLNDRLIRRDIATRFEAYSHDGCGRVTGHGDDDCDGAFAYDSLGNCVSETLDNLVTASTYDAVGNRLSLTYPSGRALAYSYDSNNRCSAITESGTSLASFDYTGVSRLSRVTYGNGTRTLIGHDGLAGTPNAAGDHGFGRIKRIRHERVANSAVIDDRTFGYDPAQNKTTRAYTAPFTLGGVSLVQTFEYNALNALINARQAVNFNPETSVSYSLDPMGNRTSVTGGAYSGLYTLDATSPSPADSQMNQYTSTPGDNRTYDNNGNLVGRSSATRTLAYQYDYADRLVAVDAVTVDAATGTTVITPVASYTYDALGRRVSKTVSSAGLTDVVTRFLYDGDHVIEERVGGVVSGLFVHATGLKEEIRENDSVIQMRRGTQDYFVHADDLGNALALTDSSGNIVERYSCDDYGTITFLTSDGTPTSASSSSFGNVYCWGGLRLDAETGLHNDDGDGYFAPSGGRGIVRQHQILGEIMRMSCRAMGNNPWSGGDGGWMQKGVVKFFNQTKGF